MSEISPLQLHIRPARAEDRDAVFAMVATVWDGTDYIPRVWDEWLVASDGPLLVGELDERPVALYKLTELSNKEDWFEGVRVDPEYRGRGLARALARDCIQRSRQRGKRALRYITSQKNPTMQRIAVDLGFQLCYAPTWHGAQAIEGAATWQRLPDDTLPKLLADLEVSPLLRLTRGLYTYGWSSQQLTEERLREHLANGTVVGLPGQAAWAIIDPSIWGGYWICHAEGPNDQLGPLFHALRSSPEPFEGEVYVRAQMHPDAPLIPALLEAGFELGDHGACIFEYVL